MTTTRLADWADATERLAEEQIEYVNLRWLEWKALCEALARQYGSYPHRASTVTLTSSLGRVTYTCPI